MNEEEVGHLQRLELVTELYAAILDRNNQPIGYHVEHRQESGDVVCFDHEVHVVQELEFCEGYWDHGYL